jgi:hypothetical protein
MGIGPSTVMFDETRRILMALTSETRGGDIDSDSKSKGKDFDHVMERLHDMAIVYASSGSLSWSPSVEDVVFQPPDRSGGAWNTMRSMASRRLWPSAKWDCEKAVDAQLLGCHESMLEVSKTETSMPKLDTLDAVCRTAARKVVDSMLASMQDVETRSGLLEGDPVEGRKKTAERIVKRMFENMLDNACEALGKEVLGVIERRLMNPFEAIRVIMRVEAIEIKESDSARIALSSRDEVRIADRDEAVMKLCATLRRCVVNTGQTGVSFLTRSSFAEAVAGAIMSAV